MSDDQTHSSFRVPEAHKSELSPHSCYSQYSVKAHIANGIQGRFGLSIDQIDLTRNWTLSELEDICVQKGGERLAVRKALEELRGEAFSRKYSNYSYANDLRGLAPFWHNEILDILHRHCINLDGITILDVGAGNGAEIPFLFSDAKRIIAVDVSEALLCEAKSADKRIEYVCNAAENMHNVANDSIELYVSLRTFQSSLFDVSAALNEARRVLKAKGKILVSIADGFLDCENGQMKIVRGLLMPGSHTAVDKNAGTEIAEGVASKMVKVGFRNVTTERSDTDIYILAEC